MDDAGVRDGIERAKAQASVEGTVFTPPDEIFSNEYGQVRESTTPALFVHSVLCDRWEIISYIESGQFGRGTHERARESWGTKQCPDMCALVCVCVCVFAGGCAVSVALADFCLQAGAPRTCSLETSTACSSRPFARTVTVMCSLGAA
jgi:hypothetical protein